MEEKIIERADRKLFLDAAVIQQGRLAEQHSAMEKGELMKMVRFGADQILSGKGGTYSDQGTSAASPGCIENALTHLRNRYRQPHRARRSENNRNASETKDRCPT